MIQERFLIWITAVLGGSGLWLIAISFSGLGASLFPELFKSKNLEKLSGRESDVKMEPFSVRVVRTLQSFGRKKQDKIVQDENLEARLLRAGVPFYSAAHFYSRQFAYTLIYGAAGLFWGLVISVLIKIPPITLLLFAFGMGYFGSKQPANEVKSKLAGRKKDMTVEMAMTLKRLIMNLDALGDIQSAIRKTSQSVKQTAVNPEEQEAIRQRSKEGSSENSILMGQVLTGYGGNLFAEALNRFAALLASGKTPKYAVEHTSKFYPQNPSFQNFLDVLVGGLEGKIQVTDRLNELLIDLRHTLGEILKENVAKARQVVIAFSAACLLAIFGVVGAPIVQLALDLFL